MSELDCVCRQCLSQLRHRLHRLELFLRKDVRINVEELEYHVQTNESDDYK